MAETVSWSDEERLNIKKEIIFHKVWTRRNQEVAKHFALQANGILAIF